MVVFLWGRLKIESLMYKYCRELEFNEMGD